MEKQVNKLLDSVIFRLSIERGSIINFDFEKVLSIQTYKQLLQLSDDKELLDNIIQARRLKNESNLDDYQRILSRISFYFSMDDIADDITGQQAFDEAFNTVSNLQPLSFLSRSRDEWNRYFYTLLFSIVDVILEKGDHSRNEYISYIKRILTKTPVLFERKKYFLNMVKENLSYIIESLSDFGNPSKIENEDLCESIFRGITLTDKNALAKAGSSIMQLIQDKKTGRVFKWEDICADSSKSTDAFKDLVHFDTTGLSKREICALLAEDAEEETPKEGQEEELSLEGYPILKYRSYNKKVGETTYKYDIFDLKKLVDQGQVWDPYHRFKLDYDEINHRYTTIVQTLKRSNMNDVLDDIKQTPLETTKGRLIKIWFKFKYPIKIEEFMGWDLEKYSLLLRYLSKGVSEGQSKQIYFGIKEHNRIRLLKIWASVLDELTSESEEMASRVEQALYIVNES